MKHLLFYIFFLIGLCQLPINSLSGQNYCFPEGLQSNNFYAKSIKFGNITNEFVLPTIYEGIPTILNTFSDEMWLDIQVDCVGETYLFVFVDIANDGIFKVDDLILNENFSSGNISTVLTLDKDLLDLLQNESKEWLFVVSEKNLYEEGITCEFPDVSDYGQKFMQGTSYPPTVGPKYRISTTIASKRCLKPNDPLVFSIENLSSTNLDIAELQLRVINSAFSTGINLNQETFDCNELEVISIDNAPVSPYSVNCFSTLMPPNEKWVFKTANAPNIIGQVMSASITINNNIWHKLPGYYRCRNTEKIVTNEDVLPIPTSKINKIFPNPTSDNTILEFELVETENVTIEIYDICGKLIQPILNNQELEEGMYNLQLPLADFQNGTYFLLWEVNDKREIKKLIKTK